MFYIMLCCEEAGIMKGVSNEEMLKGSLPSSILRMSFPCMYGAFFQALYDIVDMIWIGRISASAVAAVTIYSTFFWIMETVNEVVGASSVALISQYHGLGDLKMTQLVSEQTLIFKVLLALIVSSVMAVLLKPAYGLYTNDPEVIRFGLEYGYIRTAFIPMFFASYSVNTIFRCTGNAVVPMTALTISSVINIFMDPLFMFDVIPGTNIRGLGLGMAGAAIATVAAIGFSFLYCFILLLIGKAPIKIRPRELLRLNKEVDIKLLTIGLPNGLTIFATNCIAFILMRLAAVYGTAAIAASGIAARVNNLCLMPAHGIQTGSGILLGHCLGAGDKERAMETSVLTQRFSFLLCLPLALLLFIFPKSILQIFMGNNAQIIRSDIFLIRIIGCCVIVASLYPKYCAAFSGSGDTKPLFYSILIMAFCVQAPYAFTVVKILSLRVEWLWLTLLLGEAAKFFALRHFFFTRDWIYRRVWNK